MRAPSAKTLTSTFRLPSEAVKLICKFAAAADDGEQLKDLVDTSAPETASYVRSMHSDPYRSKLWRTTVALHAINEHLGTYGVEGLGPTRSGDYAHPYEYLNAGDPHTATLIYDRDKDRLFVGSWGDLAEKHPKWERSESHAKKKTSPSHHATKKPKIGYFIRSTGPRGVEFDEVYVYGPTSRSDEGIVGHDLRVRPTRLGPGTYTSVVSPDDVEWTKPVGHQPTTQEIKRDVDRILAEAARRK